MKKILIGTALTAALLVGCSSNADDELTEEITALQQQVEQVTLENEDLLYALQEERAAFKEALGDNTESDEEGNENEDIDEDDSNEKIVIVQAEDIEEYPKTLYKEEAFDSKESEAVELHVNADLHEDGSLVMDDGQNWLLLMKKDGKTYPIYNDYLQLGDIDFVITPFNGQVGVLMIMTSHSDTMINKIIYDEQEDGYKVERIYEENNL